MVTHGEVSEIFNFETLQWRPGPAGHDFYYAGYGQLGDTFILQLRNEIFKFNHINYSWINMGELLKVQRSDYPGVIAVPDYFVSCE